MTKLGQIIYDDCVEVLSNVTDTKAEANVYIKELHQMLRDDISEVQIYAWLKETTDKIYNNQG